MINKKLAKKQKLSPETIGEILLLHDKRDEIEAGMKEMDPVKHKAILKIMFLNWRANEYKLQELWGFEKNANYHQDYLLPHCTCPKMDNQDYLGTNMRWTTEGCIYHGRKK